MKNYNTIILEKDLEISFKGDRDYIYASDMFILIAKELIAKDFTNIKNIDFSVHSISNKEIKLLLFQSDVLETNEDNLAQIKFESNDTTYFGVIRKGSSEILKRTEYNEKEVFSNAEIDKVKQRIELSNDYKKYSNLDVLTAMNKRLLYEVRPDIEGKWLSVRLQLDDLEDLLKERSNYAVELIKVFSNKYSKSILLSNNKKIGNLFFSLI
ncbi:hypothetical protein [Aquimarina sp. MMG016]|uniref:hypothetical protein n=1 Tax=Aquimarina sp. MMG016 TaxID=2822690 RepID=UPI001B39F10E|nr:hypothetical protein [Aquimarina sp. MMG016]MBQ4820078.1 hypothetical protein [Aquimarina sp. MMG016]